MQKRSKAKVVEVPQTDSLYQQRTAASRSKSARLLHAVAEQHAAHELLDQLGAAKNSEQLRLDLDAAAVKQAHRLTLLLNKLRTKTQRNQVLQRTLTAAGYADYESQLQQPSSSEEIWLEQGFPAQLQRYQDLITAADKLNALAESAATRSKRSGKTNASRDLRYRAAAAYERACEYLDEQLKVVDLAIEQQIRAWLDRDFDYTVGGNIAIDCVGVARIRGSRSKYCRGKTLNSKADRIAAQHECQIAAVVSELQDLIYTEEVESEQETQAVSSKLQDLLRIKDDDALF